MPVELDQIMNCPIPKPCAGLCNGYGTRCNCPPLIVLAVAAMQNIAPLPAGAAGITSSPGLLGLQCPGGTRWSLSPGFKAIVLRKSGEPLMPGKAVGGAARTSSLAVFVV